MLVSYRWLVELLPGLALSPTDLARRMTLAGLAVDAVRPFGAGLEDVIVARVEAREPHPQRPNLQLVTVARDRGETQRVVCGAPNVPERGGLVALARVGARLPGSDTPLTARSIGGVESQGMLASETELGLGSDGDGLLLLPPELGDSVGRPLPVACPAAQDFIFDVDVTPNRPDALGHVGIARDIAAVLALPFRPPEAGTPARIADARLDELVRVMNEDYDRCPHYGAAVVLDVSVGPSPLALRWRLFSLGIRPISNVVDVTNLLLVEFGQPMHAFDLDRVRDRLIVVRRARPSEPFSTLDGVARDLDTDDLVICDGGGPTALAGVMGGLDSEIKSDTRRVLLECAYFTPRGVRRSSRRHGLHTESSHRFERGTDRGMIPRVLDRAVVLLTELAGASAVPGRIHDAAPEPELPRIRLRAARMNALLGVEVPFETALERLERLGLTPDEPTGSGDDRSAIVRGATHRPDIGIEADLIEEVARVGGLDAIPTTLPRISPQPPRITGKLERDAANAAANLGLSEALTYAFVAPKDLTRVSAPAPSVTLANPLTEERSVMRTSLLPGLLEALGRARRRGEQSVRLFSVGPRFLSRAAADDPIAQAARPLLPEDVGLPEERPSFAAILSGPRPSYLEQKPAEVDVYDAKGVACEIVERLTGRQPRIETASKDPALAHLHPRGAASVWLDGVCVGRFGPLNPNVVDALDLGAGAQVIELDLAAIEAVGTTVPKYRPIPKLPAVTRDLSLVVRDDIRAGDVEELIREAAADLCESIEIVTEFRGGSVPDGHRSITFRVVYRDPKAATHPDEARTLTDKDVDGPERSIIELAGKRLGATLRG